VPLSTDKLPALATTLGAAAVSAPVVDTAGAAASALAAAPVAAEADQEEEEVFMKLRPRQPPKAGKLSFNIQGAKTAMAAAKAQVEAEEAVKAVRARRLNSRDASTQTVRDPEQDGDYVVLLRLRPRGMESFPHFPRQPAKKKARGSTLAATELGLAATEDGYELPTTIQDDNEHIIQV